MTALADWGVERVRNVALDIYDAVHCLGPVVRFPEWQRQFCPEASRETAERTWARRKAQWRTAGLAFEAQNLWEVNDNGEVWAIVMESTDQAMDLVERLMGKADEQGPVGLPTRTLAELCPGIETDEVEELIAALAADLTGEGR